MSIVRVATVPYVNAAPLIWGLSRPGDAAASELVAEPPARIADLLREGRVDVGLLPVIELQRLEGLEVLPGLCIASRQRARSVFLASRRPIEQVRRVALDSSSRTSAALLRVLLAHRRVAGVSFSEHEPRLPDMLRENDAALLIGDAALKADTSGLQVYDLAEEWYRMTGLPFVFAVWAARAGTPLPRGEQPFVESCRDGLAHIDEIADRESARLGLPRAVVAGYLRENIHYDLGEAERRGLDLFFRRAHDLGLIEKPRPIAIRPASADGGPVSESRPGPVARVRRKAGPPDPRVDGILAGAADGRRLAPEEAVLLFQEAPLLDLGLAADLARRRHHPEAIVTYIVDRNINYTNVCVARCSFCAFYREPGDPEGYLHTRESLFSKIDETLALGGTGILMQGGHHPDLPIGWYEDLLRAIRQRYPALHVHAFSPSEIQHIGRVSSLSIEEVLRRLKDAGLRSIPGGGGEILVDEVRRKISPLKTMSADWLEVMETAHALGIPTTATMMFGHVETYADRAAHLEKIRTLQDRSHAGGASAFTAFISWTYKTENTALGGREVSSAEYLRTQAISRLFLDNVPNIQSSWVTQGKEIGQVALKFGANDMGSTMIEENVVRAAGAHGCTTRTELERLIREAGYVPRQRDTLYNLVT
jgi:cyclic dehypoxanthinyl futalosine synthase